MENDRESDYMVATELTRMLETSPTLLKSLKLDYSSLVARLEELMPAITTFARCTCVLVEQGETEDARQGIEAFADKFATALNMSADDGRGFCLFLVMMTLMIKKMDPLRELMVGKAWEEWFQGLWGKES